jgi:hypothetical protein
VHPGSLKHRAMVAVLLRKATDEARECGLADPTPLVTVLMGILDEHVAALSQIGSPGTELAAAPSAGGVSVELPNAPSVGAAAPEGGPAAAVGADGGGASTEQCVNSAAAAGGAGSPTGAADSAMPQC